MKTAAETGGLLNLFRKHTCFKNITAVLMIRRVFGNLYFLTFLNGFLLASLFYFKMEANYEKELFQGLYRLLRPVQRRFHSVEPFANTEVAGTGTGYVFVPQG